MFDDWERLLNTIVAQADILLDDKTPLPNESYQRDITSIESNGRWLLAQLEGLPHPQQDQRDTLLDYSSDLRAPATSILGFSQMMLEHPSIYGSQELSPAQYDSVKTIYQNVQNLLSAINDMFHYHLIYTRQIVVSADPVDVEAALNRVIASLSIDKKRFEIESKDSNCSVQADPVWLERILSSLLTLAEQHSDVEHPITIAVSRDNETTCQLSIRTNKSVSDATFQTLQQLVNGHQALSSRNFVLFNAQSVLELQGGKLHLENSPEKGLVFDCSLPLAKIDAQQGSPNG
jgi:signal transduction histidine kinase